MNGTLWQYGISPGQYHGVNTPADDRYYVYSDIIIALGRCISSWKGSDQLAYLEIGVSVGKNLFMTTSSWAELKVPTFAVAFECEYPYPKLRASLRDERVLNDSIISSSTLRPKGKLFSFSTGSPSNSLLYLAADAYQPDNWQFLAGQMASRKFDLVFSDADHSKQAVLFETEQLLKLNLLADDFVMVWDDLGFEGVKPAFMEICTNMKRTIPTSKIACSTALARGWAGMDEGHHEYGIISTGRFLRIHDVKNFTECMSMG
jgi:hypothetical protein